MKRYGLFDTVDQLWLGGHEGPVCYSEAEYDLARLAAQVVDVRLQQAPGRTRARVLPLSVYKLRDELVTDITTPDALRKLMAGEAL